MHAHTMMEELSGLPWYTTINNGWYHAIPHGIQPFHTHYRLSTCVIVTVFLGLQCSET